jgi:hypothetical protein
MAPEREFQSPPCVVEAMRTELTVQPGGMSNGEAAETKVLNAEQMNGKARQAAFMARDSSADGGETKTDRIRRG